jgi:hypothetical protein
LLVDVVQVDVCSSESSFDINTRKTGGSLPFSRGSLRTHEGRKADAPTKGGRRAHPRREEGREAGAPSLSEKLAALSFLSNGASVYVSLNMLVGL